jgi:hypothetical protein
MSELGVVSVPSSQPSFSPPHVPSPSSSSSSTVTPRVSTSPTTAISPLSVSIHQIELTRGGLSTTTTTTSGVTLIRSPFPSLHTTSSIQHSPTAGVAATVVSSTITPLSPTNGTNGYRARNNETKDIDEKLSSIRIVAAPTPAPLPLPLSPVLPVTITTPETGSNIWLVEHDGSRQPVAVSGLTEDAFSLESIDEMIRRRYTNY